MPLELKIRVFNFRTCTATKDAYLDVWHANSIGVYSEFMGAEGKHFLRAVVKTGADGVATVHSVFPGWYDGRATHIHIAVHQGGKVDPNTKVYSAGTDRMVRHIGQVYFPEVSFLAKLDALPTYRANPSKRLRNEQDMTYIADLHKDNSTYSPLAGDIPSAVVATLVDADVQQRSTR